MANNRVFKAKRGCRELIPLTLIRAEGRRGMGSSIFAYRILTGFESLNIIFAKIKIPPNILGSNRFSILYIYIRELESIVTILISKIRIPFSLRTYKQIY